MVPVPDELLMAYADGELTPQETKALDTLIGQDPTLRDRLTPFIETRIRLSTAFEHKLHEPIPDRLIAAIANAAVNEQARQRHTASLGEQLRNTLRAITAAIVPDGPLSPAAMAGSAAAILVVGVTSGWLASRAITGGSLISVADEGLVATGLLADALETNRSGAASKPNSDGASVVPVLSFRSQADGICREYRITREGTGPDSAGLACRSTDGTWRVSLHVDAPKQVVQVGDGYQTATAVNVPSVDAFIGSTIAGDAFGASDETALLKNGWQLAP